MNECENNMSEEQCSEIYQF